MEDVKKEIVVQATPIAQAVLCGDCGVISVPDKHGNCPGCGSKYIVRIERLLDTKVPKPSRITLHHLFLLDVLKPVLRWASQ